MTAPGKASADHAEQAVVGAALRPKRLCNPFAPGCGAFLAFRFVTASAAKRLVERRNGELAVREDGDVGRQLIDELQGIDVDADKPAQ